MRSHAPQADYRYPTLPAAAGGVHPYLEQIWASKTLTNNGPFHVQLEQALCDYFGVEHLALFANGTIALITALQTLRISGEVITTPYSFVATSHSLLWNTITPVFVDIDPAAHEPRPRRSRRRSRRAPPPSCRCIATATPATSSASSILPTPMA
jgi:dTDP-4-amino-4,6-dideoxygalactose transaminase